MDIFASNKVRNDTQIRVVAIYLRDTEILGGGDMGTAVLNVKSKAQELFDQLDTFVDESIEKMDSKQLRQLEKSRKKIMKESNTRLGESSAVHGKAR